MADWVKIALKTGLIAGVMIALWAVFTQIQIPVLDFTVPLQSAGFAMALFHYKLILITTNIKAKRIIIIT